MRSFLALAVSVIASVSASATASAFVAATPGLSSPGSASGFGFGFGPEGGNVYALASDPGHRGVLYAGTAGAVFVSADFGRSWNASGEGVPPTRVQALAMDPRAPAVVYAGTRTPDGVASVGIFKSTDGGGSWSGANVGLVDPFLGIGPLDVTALAVDPADSNVLVAGAFLSEIFWSGDGGATWQPATIGGYNAGLETTALVFDPANPANVYAATTLGLFKSTNRGQTFSATGNAGVAFFSLAIDPSSPSTLYAGDAAGSGIWKSTDGGAHWSTANTGLPGASGSRPPVLSLAVDPGSPSTVYAGTYGNGVWVSTNSGGSWSLSSGSRSDARVAALAFDGDGGEDLFAGTYGAGVQIRVAGANGWSSANEGLDVAVVSALLLDPSSEGLVYAATSGGVAVSSDAGRSWTDPSEASGLPSVSVASVALAGGASPSLLAGTLGSGLYRSADRGATWTSAGTGLADADISSLAVDPSAPSTVYAGTAHPYDGSSSERVYKSTDAGATWTRTSLDAGGFTVDFIAVDPGMPSRVIAGSAGASGIFRSQDGGSTWSTIATAACGGLSGVAFDPSGSAIYAAGATGVCRSTDGGVTWTTALVGGGLGAASVAVDPVTPTTVYAGTFPDLTAGIAAGLFASVDAGQTFVPLDGGVPPPAVSALAIDPAAGIVYAGSAGGGVDPVHLSSEREPPAALPASSARRPPRTVDPR